jgi:hypothetical protein
MDGTLNIGTRLMQHPGRSLDIDEAMGFPSLTPYPAPFNYASGPKTLSGVSVEGQDKAGALREGFEKMLYGKIIVIPRSKNMGFVLSDQQFTAEVWNAKRQARTLSEIDVTGNSGVNVDDPFGVPLHYATGQSRLYTINVLVDGAPNIDNVIIFDFAGETGGADITLTGTRLVVFSFAPDWSDGLREKIGYLTDVITAYDDTEQRVQLRGVPSRGVAFRVLTVDGRDSAALDSLVWGWQHRVYGVPVWQDIRPLNAPISVGGQTISVSTTDREFEVGGLCLVWRDVYDWEAFTIQSLTSSQITTVAKAQKSFQTQGTYVLPMRLGRLEDVLQLAHLSSDYAEAEVSFDIDTVK